MVEYYGIDVSEGIDIAKTSALRECVVCNYCYFLEILFDFNQKYVLVVMISCKKL